MERLKEAKNIVISVLKEAFRLTALLITFQKIYTKHFYKNDSYFWLFGGLAQNLLQIPIHDPWKKPLFLCSTVASFKKRYVRKLRQRKCLILV